MKTPVLTFNHFSPKILWWGRSCEIPDEEKNTGLVQNAQKAIDHAERLIREALRLAQEDVSFNELATEKQAAQRQYESINVVRLQFLLIWGAKSLEVVPERLPCPYVEKAKDKEKSAPAVGEQSASTAVDLDAARPDTSMEVAVAVENAL
eukprot:5092800-Amphidinium_carterae.2